MLRVVTWNLQGNAGVDVDAVAAVLQEFAADVVALQEVQRSQFRALQRASGYEHARWVFKHWPMNKPAEGLGVFAHAALRGEIRQTISRRRPPWSWRRRVALHVRVDLQADSPRSAEPSADFHFVDTHLGAGVGDGERARQARRILDRAAEGAVIVGDMNTHPRSGVVDEFHRSQLRDAWALATGGAADPPTNWNGRREGAPDQRLDYIFVPERYRAVHCEVPDDWPRYAPLSDHLPVVADLELVAART
jgi:endonuclease/exonuclease/phosphatase family metal-dependent hydrolase